MFSSKNYFSIWGLIVVILICSSAFAQSNYYYYGGGIQRTLLLSGEKVTVKFLPTLDPDDIQYFILSDSALDPNRETDCNFPKKVKIVRQTSWKILFNY